MFVIQYSVPVLVDFCNRSMISRPDWKLYRYDEQTRLELISHKTAFSTYSLSGVGSVFHPFFLLIVGFKCYESEVLFRITTIHDYLCCYNFVRSLYWFDMLPLQIIPCTKSNTRGRHSTY